MSSWPKAAARRTEPNNGANTTHEAEAPANAVTTGRGASERSDSFESIRFAGCARMD